MFHKSIATIILSLAANIGCTFAASIIAFENVHLVSMTDEKVVKNQTVVIKDNRIKEIGRSNLIEIPKNAKVIDGTGGYLMPGLADMHVHLREDWPLPQLDLYLANGVTTVRDLDGRDFMLQWQKEVKNGQRRGPSIYVSSPTIRGYEKDALELLARYQSRYDCVKLYSYFSNKDYYQIMQTAKDLNAYTVGHIPFAVGLDGVIAAGMDEIAHVEELDFEFLDFDRTLTLKPAEWWPYLIGSAVKQNQLSSGASSGNLWTVQQARLEEVIRKLKAARIPVCSTLKAGAVVVQKLFNPDVFLARPESKYLPLKYKEAFSLGREKHQLQFSDNADAAVLKHELEKSLLAALHRAGIPLVLGTDAGTGGMGIVPGFSIHDELRILIENGFSPYEAIAAGTVNAASVARAMTGHNHFGTVEVGNRADLILVNQNPLKDVANIRDNQGVMANGRWYPRAELEKMIDASLLPDILVTGAVTNICGPDGNCVTNIESVIGHSFAGQLPQDIDTITVTGPAGALPVDKSDFKFHKGFRDFYVQIPGSPVPGTYTITVKSGEMFGTATDTQYARRSIPLPGPNSFYPADGKILTAKTPTFSWGTVKAADTALYFLLQIRDPELNKEIFRRPRTKNSFSCTIPEGILKPGRTYRWRIRISDSKDWIGEQNRAVTGWLNFTMAEVLE